MASPIVTFGEIMGRLNPPGKKRFMQALPGELEMTFAGAEANVAVSVAQFGGQARFVSALPNHPIADTCLQTLVGLGVDTTFVQRTDFGRLGLYFVESGANQRPSTVIYDREGSAISLADPASYSWDQALTGARWLHVTGITPAVSETAAEATRQAVVVAKQQNITVSCDLNFRKKLWQWDASCSSDELAQKTMRTILPYVDVVIANEEDAASVLGIHAGVTDVDAGQLAIDHYPDVAREIIRQFENVSHVAITLRESISATHNRWGAMLYEAKSDRAHFGPTVEGTYKPYEITSIVDRVGGGDAFAAGLIFAMTTEALSDPATAIRFAAAASCLAHSIEGDFNRSTRAEVETLMLGSGSGRVVR